MIDLGSVKDLMAGEHCLVVAPGPSSLELEPWHYEMRWTISVNRALPYARPDFAVCIERTIRCAPWRIVKNTAPMFVFSQLGRKVFKRNVVIDMDLTKWLGDDGLGVLRLPMSPFYATAVGIWLGFERIGLVGVDLYKDRYPSEKFKQEWEEAWRRLNAIAGDFGCKIANCNPRSRLMAIEKGSIGGIKTK